MDDGTGDQVREGRAIEPERPGEGVSGRTYAGETAALRAERRRAAFLAAGLQLFGTQMYSEVSVADILKQSGLTRRSFYELFEDREQLLRAVETEAVAAPVVALLSDVSMSPAADVGAALRLLDAVFDFYAEDPRRAHVAFVAVVGVSQEMEKHRRAQVSTLAAALTNAASGIADVSIGRYAAIAFLGAFSELMIDHLWTGRSTLEDIRAELHQLLRARFFAHSEA